MRTHLPEGTLIAIVYSTCGVDLVASAPTPERLREIVGDYVASVAEWRLSPGTAERVRALHGSGLSEAAIDLYFDRVGEEWDPEWLAIVP